MEVGKLHELSLGHVWFVESDLQHSFKCIWVVPIIVHFSFYEGAGISIKKTIAMDFKLCPWFMGAKNTNGNVSPLYAKTY